MKAASYALSRLHEALTVIKDAPDMDSVLHYAAAQAARMLGTDIAYVKLYDPVHSCLVVASHWGTTSRVFRAHKLNSSCGMGGVVLHNCRPLATGDYYRDRRFDHEVDRIVHSEGVISLLAVPLLYRGDRLGLLYAGARSSNYFAKGSELLLDLLGQQTALALGLLRGGTASGTGGAPALRHKELLRGSRVSMRQGEVLRLMACGLAQKEIAVALKLSIHTVRFHMKQLAQRLDVTSHAELVAKAFRLGLLQ